MKRLLLAILVANTTLFAQQSVRQIQFDAVSDLLKLPDDVYLGEASGVAVNSKGHIFVYSRTGNPGPIRGVRSAQLFEFDPDGKFIREIGKNVYSMAWAHAVRVDHQDNVWIVDNGANMVTRFNPAGRVTLVVGRRPEAVEPSRQNETIPPPKVGLFNEPTDIGFDAADNAYVADGYKNSRVAKFDKDGRWITAWGEKGSGPGQLNGPHSIQVDAAGRVYVADRGNERIQIFDSDGKVLKQITYKDVTAHVPPTTAAPTFFDFGQKPDGTFNSLWPNTLCITPGPNQVLYASDMIPGRVFKLSLSGEVLGVFGKGGMKPGEFGHIHGMACPDENVLFIGENLTWRVQKLLLRPPLTSSR
jgi:hypothetical protein